MPRVISYTRFSSPRQARGDSYRRQTEMAMKWCLAQGLELDTDFVLADLGLSGYSGENAKRGALGVLQRMCLDSKLEEGTILLIEAFDRLTRLSLPDAYELLLSLINNGLTIVTLTDGKIWTKDTLKNLEDFMLSLVTLYRGFQESNQKSLRLRETFRAHREKTSRQAFGSAPGWLSRNDKFSNWEIDREKSEVVKQVFELSAAGLGSKAIAAQANKEKWIVPTRLNLTHGRWHAQMPGIILRNRAVLGEHEYRIHTHEAHSKHWSGTKTGLVISDYYPRIIEDDLWHRSRASIETRKVAKKRDSHYYNVWAGLLYCGQCGAPLQRKQERDGQSRAQVICADKLAGITDCATFSAKNMDATLIKEIYIYAAESLGNPNGEKGLEKLSILETQLSEKSNEQKNIVEAIAKTSASGTIDIFVNKAVEIEAALRSLRIKIDEQRQANALAESDATFDESFFEHAMTHLYSADDESRTIRATFHLKMARLIKQIWIWGYDLALIQFKDGLRLTVPLPVKKLPPRANPNARYHRPAKIKPEVRPFFEAALLGKLVVPEPQRRHERKWAANNDAIEIKATLDN